MSILISSTGIPVVAALVEFLVRAKSFTAMNSTKRLVFGVISTLLLAAGLARAADRMDPVSRDVRVSASDIVLADDPPPPPCAQPCADGGAK